MQSLQEVSEEIDDFRKTRKVSLLAAASTVLSLMLAAMLMMDPFEHFNTHVRILGLEMIASAFIRTRRGPV